MSDLRENVIGMVKSMGLTAEELGLETTKEVYVDRPVVDKDFIEGVKKYIQQVEEVEAARECIPESYWEELGIAFTMYDLVEVNLMKTGYATITLAVPHGKDIDDFIADYVDNNTDGLDIEYSESWELDNWNDYRHDVSKDEVLREHISYNYDEVLDNEYD